VTSQVTSDPKAPEAVEPIETITIITTIPSPIMVDIHDRMPVMLPQEDYKRLLNPETPSDECQSLLLPFAGELEAYPISTHVNSPKNDDPECIEKLK
jgi:putative SOS response-associated peptidase YedK